MSSNNRYSNSAGYDHWSTFYDTYPNPTIAIDEITFPTLWNNLRGKHVLEIGCGTGRHTQKLLAAGNSVVGIDPSAGMLAVARRKTFEKSPLTFIEADFMTYDRLAPQSFDAALASLVVEHINDLPSFFRRVAYVLRPNAAFYLSELHPNRTAKGTFAHFKVEETQEEVQLSSYAHTAEQMETAATDSGFRIVEKKDVLGNETLATINPTWSRYMGYPMIQLWHFHLDDSGSNPKTRSS